jgi:hypothetical protein
VCESVGRTAARQVVNEFSSVASQQIMEPASPSSSMRPRGILSDFVSAAFVALNAGALGLPPEVRKAHSPNPLYDPRS